MDQLKTITRIAVNQWEQISTRATNLLNQLTDEVLDREVAPGKNTGRYIMGHLIAIHDVMLKILNVGEAKYPDLFEIYVKQPDGFVSNSKPVQELRPLWTETHERVMSLIKGLSEEEWLMRHNTMTDEEFKANPLRNRLSVLINRTNHFSYHTGQLRLLIL